MEWDVTNVELDDNPLTLKVTFADGISGKIKFTDKSLYGVFEPLRDGNFFAKVFVDHGVVCWPGELDLAPDAMHHAIKKYGEWVIDGD